MSPIRTRSKSSLAAAQEALLQKPSTPSMEDSIAPSGFTFPSSPATPSLTQGDAPVINQCSSSSCSSSSNNNNSNSNSNSCLHRSNMGSHALTSGSGVEFWGEESCSTPKAKEFRIAEMCCLCPPAPRKRKASSRFRAVPRSAFLVVLDFEKDFLAA